MRISIAVLTTLALTACGEAASHPLATKPGNGTLVTGSIPTTGGFVTVDKPGDPLNGLTLSLPAGAFGAALSVTITSSSNSTWPTANGIVPISPVVHIASNESGYATRPITIKVPAKIPANTFPVVVMYDSTTRALEIMTTAAYDSTTVVALTTHLNTANLERPQGSRIAALRAAGSGGGAANLALTAYAIPIAVLNQDWDTEFRPGTNDWEFAVPAVALSDSSLVPFAGAALTETWYFNSGASTTPLNNRFSKIKNAALSDSLGIIWTGQFTHTQGAAFASIVAGYGATLNLQADSVMGSGSSFSATVALIEERQIRAAFALAGLTGAKPLPVLVSGEMVLNGDTTTRGQHDDAYLVAYRASGSKIYVADPGAPGDSSRALNFPSGQAMTPYNPGLYQPNLTILGVVSSSLGLIVPPGVLASQYSQVLAGTIRNPALWPTVNYRSYFGQFYDTIYVVDTLRVWAECPRCQYGIANTVAPSGATQEFMPQGYKIPIGDSVAIDSATQFTSVLIGAGDPSTTDTLVQFAAVVSEASQPNQTSGFYLTWLDYRQVTKVSLHATVSPAAAVVSGTPVSFNLTMRSASYVPASVTYTWDFGDGQPTVTASTPAAQTHTYAQGTYTLTLVITDNRNGQTIGRAKSKIDVGAANDTY